MALVRWEPARELQTFQQEMNRLFDAFFDTPLASPRSGRGNGPAGARSWMPAMDLVETDDHFVLKADLPGLDENDVQIEVADDVLTISGERTFEHEAKNEGYVRLERGSGRFSRSLALPDGVDPQRIQASFDKGVLEVRIPKPEQRKPRRVEISVGAKPTIEGQAAAAAPTN